MHDLKLIVNIFLIQWHDDNPEGEKMSEPEKDPAREKPAAAINRCSMISLLASNRRGAIVVFFALIMPILIGFMGMAVEVGYWYSKHRDLQAAADAAALAASYEIAESRPTNALVVATREATNNGWNSTDGTITVRGDQYNSTFPAGGSFTADSDAVEVELTLNVPRMFSAYFISTDITLDARAVGKSASGSTTACVLALGSANQSKALNATGSTSVTMTGCSAATNSTNSNAASAVAGFSLDCIYSAGGGSGSPTMSTCSSIQTNQPAITDPYEAVVTKPADSDFDACTTYIRTTPGVDENLSAGVYCDLEYNSNNKTLTLAAGTYYLDRGDLRVTSGATIDGTAGVTIVFGDSTGSGGCGGVAVQGGSSLNLTAPTSGNFSGLALYRSSACDTGEDFNFSGTTDSTIIGAIYNPAADIVFTGNGTVGSTCLQVIGDTVTFTGNSTLGSTCAAAGTQTITAGATGSLVE